MSGVIVEGAYPILERKTTGLFSLDWCLGSRGEYGAPLRALYEIYGYPNAGKSTLCYYLAGKLTDQPRICICDLENLDRYYVERAVGQSKFNGVAKLVDVIDEKKVPRWHEDMLTDMTYELMTDSGSTILDSVGALTPHVEMEGDYGEAFMGKRAKLVAQLSRALANTVRNAPERKTAFVINHVHQIIGGRGHKTAGGDTLTFMANVRIMIWPSENFTVSDDDPTPIGFLVNGKTEKLRFGAKGRPFSYYIVPGLGVHPGVSAMFDCFDVGLAERGGTVKMNGKSMGYLKKDLLAYALEGKERKFEPFIEALHKYQDTALRFEESAGEEEENDLPDSKTGRGKGKVE